MSIEIMPALAPTPALLRTPADPDPVAPYRLKPVPWLSFGALLLTLQLAIGADPLYAVLVFAFIMLTGATLAALDGITSPLGCCVAFLAFQHVIFCQVVKAVLWQRPDSPLLRPVETAGVYVVGMSSLLLGAWIWRWIRPIHWRPTFRRELDTRRLLWMTGFCFTIGAIRYVLSRSGSHLVGINAADIFEPLSIAAGTAYTIVVSNGRKSVGPVNALPMLLSFVTGAIGASRLNLLTGPVVYYLTCCMFRFKFRVIHLFVLLGAAYVAQFILFPYALYARNFVRTRDFDTNVAKAADLLVDVVVDPVTYQQKLQRSERSVRAANRRLRYYGTRASTLDRFAVILWADAIVDATDTQGTIGMKLIEPGFQALLPHYLDPAKGGVGTSNLLAHRAKGMVDRSDHVTQLTLGFFCDSYSSFSWLGVALIPALILLGYSLICHLLFDRTLWYNVMLIAVTKSMAWSFSEATIAPQITNVIVGFVILLTLMWLIRGLINQTQNFHDTRLRKRAQRTGRTVPTYPTAVLNSGKSQQ